MVCIRIDRSLPNSGRLKNSRENQISLKRWPGMTRWPNFGSGMTRRPDFGPIMTGPTRDIGVGLAAAGNVEILVVSGRVVVLTRRDWAVGIKSGRNSDPQIQHLHRPSHFISPFFLSLSGEIGNFLRGKRKEKEKEREGKGIYIYVCMCVYVCEKSC